MGGIMLLISVIVSMQFWSLLQFDDKKTERRKHHDINTDIAAAIANNNRRLAPNIDWTMWSKDQAYMRDCILHYKNNETWGRMHAPFVDKVEAKNIIAKMNIQELMIIPTLAIFDQKNITKYTLELMKSIKQPYIIKSTHMSGGVARVYNNTYHCFKYCEYGKVLPLGPAAYNVSRAQWMLDIHDDYSRNGGELQYRYIRPQIIIEEDIISGGKTSTDVTFWWLSNGHPVFISEQCEPAGDRQGFQMKRVFINTDHKKLPLVFNRGVCETPFPRPSSWDSQLDIVNRLGKAFPNEVVRIDLYAGGNDVYFSEFTFTTAGCWRSFTPALADGLLYALMKNKVSPNVVTPDYVERKLNDRSWVALSLDERMQIASINAHPSPVDLCLQFEVTNDKELNEKLFASCIKTARKVQHSNIRCIVSKHNGTKIDSFGIETGNCKEQLLLPMK